MAIRTNVMTDRSLSCRTLAMVASALSRVFGVEVATSGTEAYTSPPEGTRKHYLINVPAMDYDDKNYLTLIRGYIDHEVGHVRFTDMAEASALRKNGSMLSLWNILEDPYVEYKMGLCYMGCERNLRDLGRMVFTLEETKGNIEANVPSRGHTAYFSYLLYTVRAMLDPDHFNPIRDYIIDVCNQLGSAHILQGIDDILKRHDYHPSRTNTKKNAKIAKAIHKLLREAVKGNALSTSDAPSESSLGESIREQLKEDTLREMVRDNLTETLENNAMNDSDPRGLPSSTPFDTARKAASRIKGTNSEMASNPSIPMPDSDFNSAGSQTFTDRLVGNISGFDKRQAMNIRAVLDLRLRSLLQSYIMSRGGSAACGKLDMHKLHRLAVNNPHIFQHRVEKKGVDTEVIVLVDVSGSMTGRKATMTTQAMYALMTSLSRIRGVRAGAFGFNADSFPCYVPMGGAVTDKMCICPGGGTLLGEAINSCLSRFNYDEGSRQVLIILSDGDSQNPRYVSHMFKKAKAVGVEVAAVGILDKYIMTYSKDADCRVINDLKELPSTLFNILQDKLVVGGLR